MSWNIEELIIDKHVIAKITLEKGNSVSYAKKVSREDAERTFGITRNDLQDQRGNYEATDKIFVCVTKSSNENLTVLHIPINAIIDATSKSYHWLILIYKNEEGKTVRKIKRTSNTVVDAHP